MTARRFLTTPVLITVYLAAIVFANLLVARFGPTALIFTAIVLIGCDITVRDRLHTVWGSGVSGERDTDWRSPLWPRMFALIAAGSLLSWLLNRGAGPVALASFVAFGLAAIADTAVYHVMRHRPFLHKVNASNVAASIVDSLLFQLVAFGGISWWIFISQTLLKILGGFLWSLVLSHRREPDNHDLFALPHRRVTRIYHQTVDGKIITRVSGSKRTVPDGVINHR